MSVTSSRFDLEDALLDGQERDIESSSSEVEDEHISLALGLLVQPIGDCCRGGLVDDSENVQSSDEAGILGGLTLGVVEVCGDSDNSVVDSAT